MELVLDFNELNVDELDMLDGYCWVCKAGGVISVALIIIALIFIFDIDGIASSVIALTASMIALSIPYDRISVKE